MQHQCFAQTQVQRQVEKSIVGDCQDVDVGSGVEEVEAVDRLGKDLVGKGLGVVVFARPDLQYLVPGGIQGLGQMGGHVARTYQCYFFHRCGFYKKKDRTATSGPIGH